MASLKVLYGQLAKQLVAKNIKEGTTIVGFCEANHLSYNANIRVNGATVNREYVLQGGDIITSIGNVDGGY